MKNDSSDEVALVCGVIVNEMVSHKLLVPAPFLILNSISFAHELLEDSIELATAYHKARDYACENSERYVAASLKQWIEHHTLIIKSVPALDYRAAYKPLVVSHDTITNYLRTVIRNSKPASKRHKPRFLIDNSWRVQDACLFTTKEYATMLRHAGKIAVEELSDSELQNHIAFIRPPWDGWR